MTNLPDAIQVVFKVNDEVRQLLKESKESGLPYGYKYCPEEENLNESNFSISEEKRKINIQELLELRKESLMIVNELQEAKAETERLKHGECSHLKDISLLLLEKEGEKRKTRELQDTIKKLKEEAIEREQAFRQAKQDTEARHRKELGQLATILEATTTKAEQASTDLQKIKQGSTKALAKLNTKLAKNTAALTEKEQELSKATEALATKSSESEDIFKTISEIKQSHSNCSKTIKSLEIDLRDAKAINNARRTSTHAEADRMRKGIAKATADLEARLNELKYNNQGLESKCRMFEDRYSEQVIASAKKEEQLIRSVVEERRSHDQVLELQRDIEKDKNRFFELELKFQNLCHKFGVDRE